MRRLYNYSLLSKTSHGILPPFLRIQGRMKKIYSMMFSFVFLWIFAIWTIVGFLFWIPLLVRTISLVSATMIFIAISSSDTTSRSYLMRYLQNAIDFYLGGFQSIYSTLNDVKNEYGSRNVGDSRTREIDIDWATVFYGTIFALLFWLISLSFALQDYTAFIVIQSVIQSTIGALIYAVQSVVVPAIIIGVVIIVVVIIIGLLVN
jgi:hypothetical protein